MVRAALVFLEQLELLQLQRRKDRAELLFRVGFRLIVSSLHLLPARMGCGRPCRLEGLHGFRMLFLKNALHLGLLAIVQIEQGREAVHPLRLVSGLLLWRRRSWRLGGNRCRGTQQRCGEEADFHLRLHSRSVTVAFRAATVVAQRYPFRNES